MIKRLDKDTVNMFLVFDSIFIIGWSYYLQYLHPHSGWDFIGWLGAYVLMGLSPMATLKDTDTYGYKMSWWASLTTLLLIAVEMALASMGVIPDSLGLIS